MLLRATKKWVTMSTCSVAMRRKAASMRVFLHCAAAFAVTRHVNAAWMSSLAAVSF
ncbi:hypothetical protein AMTR_s00122p00034120 [Amborella trichopoda]|uniref:Uncharacterized protein n=1 Tax=Amborella trichopoda TaxID=13333 RepID=W1NQF1_AMBTC|nr:hypothetical protein AMTR_s00122p00034120 [Amborella trichopoda]